MLQQWPAALQLLISWLLTLAPQVMVANVRCNEIKQEQLAGFAADQAWQALASQAEQGLVPEFGPRLGGLLDSCVNG
jgi:hypothetical protein